MTTMKFIENHIMEMMEIWGGVDAIKAHAAPIVDTREGDDKLLNGPKLAGDVGHASQGDIDALFD
jgi:chemotaxis protein CheZ